MMQNPRVGPLFAAQARAARGLGTKPGPKLGLEHASASAWKRRPPKVRSWLSLFGAWRWIPRAVARGSRTGHYRAAHDAPLSPRVRGLAEADPAALLRNRGSDTLLARSAGSRDVPAHLARRTPTRPDLARVRLPNRTGDTTISWNGAHHSFQGRL